MPEVALLNTENLDALLDSGDRPRLRMLLNEQHPADLAEYLSQLSQDKRQTCFRLLDIDNASETLAQMEPELQIEILKELGELSVATIISRMSPDDAVDLLSELPTDRAGSIIAQLADTEAAKDIQELMAFKEDSAGGIMSTDYLALEAHMSIEESLAKLREVSEQLEEDIYDVYVVDEQGKLVGRITLKDLLTAKPGDKVAGLMDANVIKVSTDTDQTTVAEKLSRYDLLSLPVVDVHEQLRGIVTADDVIDVIQEEAAEDIFHSSGIETKKGEPGEALSYNVSRAFRARLPWLIGTLFMETGSAAVINHFDLLVQQTVAAAAFMPLLSGVTGSVAVQSTCIVIHSTSSGALGRKTIMRNLSHEVKVGLLLGVTCGIITTLIATTLHQVNIYLGLVVGISLFTTMMMGVTFGALMPIIFRKFGIEPAHASGPFITSLLDVCTFTMYLFIVHTLLHQILQS